MTTSRILATYEPDDEDTEHRDVQIEFGMDAGDLWAIGVYEKNGTPLPELIEWANGQLNGGYRDMAYETVAADDYGTRED